MKIRLNRLSLENFKGIRKFDLELNGKNVTIYGANATGKTSLPDSVRWLLFGTDSTGAAQFQIKTVNDAGNEIHHLDHAVYAELLVDGEMLALRKLLKEKHVKKRGEPKRTFTGHTTEYAIGGVPMAKKEWDERLKGLVEEETFKLLTLPTHFNSLHWERRRQLLLEVCGDVADADVIASDTKLHRLPDILGDKSLADHQKIIKARKKKINERLKEIPARIDELSKSLPEKPGDTNALVSEINILEQRLESAKEDRGRSELRRDIAKKEADQEVMIAAHQKKIRDQNAEAQKNADDLDKQIKEAVDEIVDLETAIRRAESSFKNNEDEMRKLREIFRRQANEKPDFATTCYACNQPLPEENIARAEKAWRENQAKSLADINQDGATRKLANQENQKIIDESTKKIDALKQVVEINQRQRDQIVLQDASLARPPEAKDIEKELTVLQHSLAAHKPPDTSELEAAIKEKRQQVAEIEASEKTEKRIDELNDEEKHLATQFENLEHETALIEQFIVAKVGMLESQINKKFNMVKFKLFEQQINEGIKETCVTTVNGVPWPDVNDGHKILAGLDIVNVLQEHYGIEAPCFLDHRESLTIEPEANCQLISLVADPKYDELTVLN